jgi:phosphate transport system protein
MHKDHSLKQFDLDQERIRAKLLMMAGIAENQLYDALVCFRTGNEVKAERVIQNDSRIDQLEVEIDNDCSHLIVKWQPAANDLRTVVATLKVITDIERIGDEAAKIARVAMKIRERAHPTLNHTEMTRVIATYAQNILRVALDAFARLDKTQVKAALSKDAAIDHEFTIILRNLIIYMMEDTRTISAAIDTLWVAKAIERIGDHAKNIAEYVIYVVDGKDIRHAEPAQASFARP